MKQVISKDAKLVKDFNEYFRNIVRKCKSLYDFS